MILAAAVKYRIEKTDTETILCGARHADIIAQLPALGFEPHVGYKELEQGFIDHNGNFLGRAEAYFHAKDCGQLPAVLIKNHEDRHVYLLTIEELW